jgi:hypothetical protein
VAAAPPPVLDPARDKYIYYDHQQGRNAKADVMPQ